MKKGIIYGIVTGAVVIMGLISVYLFGMTASDSSTGEIIIPVEYQDGDYEPEINITKSNKSILISPKEFKEKIDSKEYVLVDIRTTKEDTNEKIPNTELVLDFYKDNFSEEVSKLDKDKKYLYYCRTGNRTSHASVLAEQFNFAEAYELDGGIVAWKKAGYNIE